MLFAYVMVRTLLGYQLIMFVAEILTSHAFSCPHGAFPIIRHNKIFASLLSEICHDIKIEHYLQPLTVENLRYKTAVCDDNASLDIHATGFWGSNHQHVFFMHACLIS